MSANTTQVPAAQPQPAPPQSELSAPTLPQGAPPPPSRSAPSPQPLLGPATLFAALIVTGLLATFSAIDVIDLPTRAVLAAGAGVLGIGLIIGAFAGRARWLMWIAIPVLALVAIMSTSAATSTMTPWSMGTGAASGTVGDRFWLPTQAAETTQGYALGVGTGTLDLTAMQLPTDPEARIPINARVDVGTLIVQAPTGVPVIVDARAGLGTVVVGDVDRPEAGGVNQRIVADLPGSVDPDAPTILLNLSVGMGTVEVTRG